MAGQWPRADPWRGVVRDLRAAEAAPPAVELVVEDFTFMPATERFALVRLNALVVDAPWNWPAVPALRIETGGAAVEVSPLPAPARRTTVSGRVWRWQIGWAVPLDLLEPPDARFRLAVPSVEAVELPRAVSSMVGACTDGRWTWRRWTYLRAARRAAAVAAAVSALSAPAALAEAACTSDPKAEPPVVCPLEAPEHKEPEIPAPVPEVPAPDPAPAATPDVPPPPVAATTAEVPTPEPVAPPEPRESAAAPVLDERPVPERAAGETERTKPERGQARTVRKPERQGADKHARSDGSERRRRGRERRDLPARRTEGRSGGREARPAVAPSQPHYDATMIAGPQTGNRHVDAPDEVPAFLEAIYRRAERRYDVPWQVLAAVNEIETAYGSNVAVSSAGAIGWMQFMPATWRQYGVDANRDGRRNPYDPEDAVFAAARYLRASGARDSLRRALWAYNHADWYVDAVLLRASRIGRPDRDLFKLLRATRRQLEERVLADPRITIYACGREDIARHRVDPRVLIVLELLAESGLEPTVTSMQCGHSYLTASGNVSEHSTGSAVDIAAFNGHSVLGNQGPGSITERAIRALLTLRGDMQPHQIISLMSFEGADNTFAMADHADHLHVGFRPAR